MPRHQVALRFAQTQAGSQKKAEQLQAPRQGISSDSFEAPEQIAIGKKESAQKSLTYRKGRCHVARWAHMLPLRISALPPATFALKTFLAKRKLSVRLIPVLRGARVDDERHGEFERGKSGAFHHRH